MDLDIIVPVYNEENVIETTLSRIIAVKFPKYITDIHIIVVDDHSSDSSTDKVKAFKYKYPEKHIELLKLNKNAGKGAAVRYGIENSGSELITIQDADLELIPDDIPVMIETLTGLNLQFVNGSRYLPGIPRPLPSYRRYLANRFMTWLTSMLINVKLTDMACGHKLFTRNLYEKLELRENRFGFEAELIIKSMRIRKNNITEIPVNYFPRDNKGGKKLKNIEGIKILFAIVKYSLKR